MKTSYDERDYAFGQMMLTLRTAIGLTQGGLADLLGISRRAVGEWEAGSSYPKPEHLKHFISLAVKHQAFPAGSEAQEIHTLWKAAHQKVILDEQWLSALLNQQSSPPRPIVPPMLPNAEQISDDEQITTQPVIEQRVDWGDALTVPIFYGREQELDDLTRWVIQERCRVVNLLGIGGVGKSALAVNVMYQLAEHFEVVIFRSLRDAPSCEALLDDCLQVLSPQPLATLPGNLDRRISLLLDYLRQFRSLVVLDNLETLLEEGSSAGRYRPGFESYGRLLQRVAATEHQSCLLLTSREKPVELRPLEGPRTPVRTLRLLGLEATACEQLLAENDMTGTPQDWARLVEIYAGNPLALKMVAETITDLFGGEISQFLSGNTVIFGSIADLLSEQFSRLSPLEQTVLCWLAIMREPVTLEELLEVLVARLPRVQILEALDGLRRRSLVERGQRQASFTLQSVVLEYVIEVLITNATSEIQHDTLDCLIQHGLQLAHSKEYVRQTQERVLLTPLLTNLQRVYQGHAELEEQILVLLNQLREQADYAQGYGPANLINLLRLQRGHLRGVDLSQLVIRKVNMQGVEMQDTSLSEAVIRDTIFTEALDVPRSVAISSRGEYWAAGSMRGVVHVWRKGIQVLHLAWQAHNNAISTLAFSPDEHFLATGSWDGALKLWEVASGALLWTGGWHTKGLNCTAFSPDGSLLASSGSDATVRLWDPWRGTNRQELLHPDPVYALAWSPDGSLLATGDFVGIIRLWQMQQNAPATCIQTLSGHKDDWVMGLSFAPDGKTLASACRDQTIKLWDVESEKSGHLFRTLSGHTDQVYQVLWSPNGQTLASCGIDQTIRIWDVAQGRYRAVLHEHGLAVYGLAFTSDGSRLLSSSEDGSLRIWDMASEKCVYVMQGYAVSFYDIDWSPDSIHLVSGSTDGLVIIWDATEEEPARILRGHRKLVCGVAWSPDGRWIASGGWDRAIRIWKATSGACLQIFHDPNNPDTIFYGVAWSSDGRYLACGSDVGGVQVWDVIARHQLWGGRKQPMWIEDVAWSPNGTHVASTGDDGSVYLWNPSDGTLLQQLTGHHGRVNGVVWSPEGNQLVSCGGEEDRGELFVWDVQNEKCVQTFVELPSMVYAAAWGPNGNLLISGGSDGKLRWWDVQSGQNVSIQPAHQGAVQSLRRSPDGRRLASCGDDGAIMIWDLNSAEPLHTLRHDRPYERLNITGIRGLTAAQKTTLRTLGAIEEIVPPNMT
jgi:WD40 repeat protein/transcriptional regulator with XRE-family HTH domain